MLQKRVSSEKIIAKLRWIEAQSAWCMAMSERGDVFEIKMGVAVSRLILQRIAHS